ncbi:metallophosphoesterase [Myxozyma melibiosi]|uniref:Purple acid phosphatase n=1 Tax=Myxozyma melibiosi TaxID=54550 RepID=A0ABR1F1I5_9ASCO
MKFFSSAIAAFAFAVSALAQIDVPGAVPKNPLEPLQHRLAYAGPTGMTVSWNTYAEIKKPEVHYGENVWDLSSVAYGSSNTYETSPTWANHVTIYGLKPDTTYYYTVSHTNCYNCSEIPAYTFTTARPRGDFTPYTAAVVIDMGVMGEFGESAASEADTGAFTASDSSTMQSLSQFRDGFELLLHPGDLAYADSWLTEYLHGYLNITLDEGVEMYNLLLNQFFDEMQPVTSVRPYMVGPGNHESNCDEGGKTYNGVTYDLSICPEGQRNFTYYKNYFSMPGEESGGVDNFWYSFDHGMVHYVMIDTETDLGNGLVGDDETASGEDMDSGPFGSYENEQIDWLENDLANVDRSLTPWVIVSGHRPWYASADNDSTCANCQTAFEPLLVKYNVDMVFYGHIHMYERNDPVAYGVVDPNGLNDPSAPMYILNGLGGHYHGTDDYSLPLTEYSRYLQNETYGWSRLTFHNCTHVTHDFIASANGTVLDSATLYKNHGCSTSSSSSTSITTTSNYTSNYTANSTVPSVATVTTNAAGITGVPSIMLAVTLVTVLIAFL